MKAVKILILAALIISVAGLGYLAITDIVVEKTTISETIPNERFFNNKT